jgi:ADP-ribose pyrophosphatase YjhB (NUDIX family)
MTKITLKARLILFHKGKILLLKQKRKQGGNFTLVGGTIETKETAIQAVIRETEEEAGILVKAEDLQLAHVLHKKTKNGQRITLYFKAQSWKGTFRNKEPEKFKGVSWFALNMLPSNLTSTARHVINQYRKGKLYSEFF